MYKHFFKRFFDIILSLLALIFLSPVFLVIAILVRLKLGSPIIFKQDRPGKNEKIFKMYKFRTMTDERDENGQLLPDEKRLTKFGRFLRATSLDELPEIWNIFTGKMSIIGPRPQLIKDLVFMNEEIRKRHNIRPGLTGLAQVSGRNNAEWDERFKHDLEYVNKLNFRLDAKVFIKTIFKVLRRSDISTKGMATSMDYGDWLLQTGQITQADYDSKLIRLRQECSLAENLSEATANNI